MRTAGSIQERDKLVGSMLATQIDVLLQVPDGNRWLIYERGDVIPEKYRPVIDTFEVPPPVSMVQGRRLVFQRGYEQGLWATFTEMDVVIAKFILAAPELSDVEKEIAGDKYRNASMFEFTDPLLQAVAPIVGIVTRNDLRDAFLEAATL